MNSKMRKNFRHFFEPTILERKITIKAIIPAVISSIIWIISVYLLKEITNNIANGWDNYLFVLLMIFIISSIFFYIVVIYTKNWTHARIRPKFRTVLYDKYLWLFVQLDNNESERIWTGKMIAMIDKGIHSWVGLLTIVLLEALPNILFIIYSFIFIWFINIYYFLIVFFVFIFIFLLTVELQKRAKIYRTTRRDVNISITKKVVNIIMSKFEILQNGKFRNEINIISKRLEKNFYLNTKVQTYNIITDILMKMLIDGAKIWIIVMFGIWLFSAKITFWEFISLMSIIYILDQIFTKSIATYIEFTKAIVDVEKLWDFFDNAPQIQWYEEWKSFSHKNGNIEIKNLNFWYNQDKQIFSDFSLKIDWEKVLALVWDSWSGKSTLVKMIAWYMRPNSGEIIVDEQKLSETSLKSYYKDIWYLTQDPSVFDGSILENLTYGLEISPHPQPLSQEERGKEIPLPMGDKWEQKSLISTFELKAQQVRWGLDKKIKEIISLAKCEFIYELPNGLETQIWERGVKLSWWQKQRLAIAKIFLKDPKIIILDEPTSALDSFSEEQITKAMQNLFQNRTVIVIAHRLQTVKHADRILVLENGKIIEDGIHDELVKKDGKYAKMLELQSGF